MIENQFQMNVVALVMAAMTWQVNGAFLSSNAQIVTALDLARAGRFVKAMTHLNKNQ